MPAPTYADYYEIGRVEMLVRRPDLVAREGDVSDTILQAGAAMADRLTGHVANRVRSTFLDGAEGADLTIEARDRGTERLAATKAIGSVTFTRPGGTGAGTIPAGFRVATQPDAAGRFVTFATDAPLVFGALDTSASVAVTAAAAGAAGNAAPGSLRLLDTPFDTTLTAANAARMVGGKAEELDRDLRDRTKAFWQTQARGTIDALAYGATRVPQVGTVAVIEDASTGLVVVYVADKDGNSNATLIAAVQAELASWRVAGNPISVVGGVVSMQSIAITLTVRSGVSVPPLVERVRSAIVAAVGRLRPGDTLFRNLISDAARAVDRDGIVEVTVITPAANIAAAQPNEIFRTAESLITVT